MTGLPWLPQPTTPDLDTAFLGLRYLNALLDIGVQRGLTNGAPCL